MVEGPAAPPPGGAFRQRTSGEDFPEQRLARLAAEEYVLPRGVLVAVAGRYRDALDAERHRLVKEVRDLGRVLAAEQRAVGGHTEAARARQADGGDRLVVYALLTHRLVVAFAVAIQVDGESQVARRAVFVDVLG